MEEGGGADELIPRGDLGIKEKKRPLYLATKRDDKGKRTGRESTIRGDAGGRRPQRKRVGDHRSLGYSRVGLVSKDDCGGNVGRTKRDDGSDFSSEAAPLIRRATVTRAGPKGGGLGLGGTEGSKGGLQEGRIGQERINLTLQ